MKRWEGNDRIWPKAWHTVGLMLKHKPRVRAGCRRCGAFMYMNEKNLKAIAIMEGEDYSLINRVSKCRLVGCGGAVIFYAANGEHTPLIPLKDSYLEHFNEGITLKPEKGDHYWIHAKLCNERVSFMIDTGSTQTIIGPDDAKRLHIDTNQLKYRCKARTMTGSLQLYGAEVASVRIGEAVFLNKLVWIAETRFGPSLLGQDFIAEFEEVSIKDRLCHIRFKGSRAKA